MKHPYRFRMSSIRTKPKTQQNKNKNRNKNKPKQKLGKCCNLYFRSLLLHHRRKFLFFFLVWKYEATSYVYVFVYMNCACCENVMLT